MHSVLMQPDWICISSDEFIDVDAINSLWSPNSHLFAIHKYKHELPFPFLFRGLLSRCELLLLFRHFCNDPQSAKRGIKWTTSASLGRRVVPNLGYILFRLLRPSKAALEQIWGEARTSGVGRLLPHVPYLCRHTRGSQTLKQRGSRLDVS